jgi:hypothetical protein
MKAVKHQIVSQSSETVVIEFVMESASGARTSLRRCVWSDAKGTKRTWYFFGSDKVKFYPTLKQAITALRTDMAHALGRPKKGRAA